jgi:hypothetical protein
MGRSATGHCAPVSMIDDQGITLLSVSDGPQDVVPAQGVPEEGQQELLPMGVLHLRQRQHWPLVMLHREPPRSQGCCSCCGRGCNQDDWSPARPDAELLLPTDLSCPVLGIQSFDAAGPSHACLADYADDLQVVHRPVLKWCRAPAYFLRLSMRAAPPRAAGRPVSPVLSDGMQARVQ